MNSFPEITDNEFVPFLKSLGVETFGKSFEWMLTDPDFAGVLRWIYNNFDQNNALTLREDYRYKEVVKQQVLLSSEELEQSISSLLEDHPGLVLPGDHESLEEIKQDIGHLQEQLNMLQHQEETVSVLIRKTELAKEELSREITNLNSVEKQCQEDIGSASQHCLTLAEEVESVTDNVVDIIADIMYVYSNAQLDIDISKRFFTYGPFEAYKQSQRLFKSHCDLFSSKKFKRKQNNPSNVNTKHHLIQAKSLEQRLFKAICDYVEFSAELSGVQAMMQLLADYQDVHTNQIPVTMMECTSAVELLEQEEEILKRQVQDTARTYLEARTKATADCASLSALKHREEVYKNLCWLCDLCQNALSLDRLLYHAVRRELRDCQDVMQFGKELRACVLEDQAAVAARIDSMNAITSQQASIENSLETTDKLLEILSTIYNIKPSEGFVGVMKKYCDMKNDILEIKDGIEMAFAAKEEGLKEFIKSSVNIRKYISDGPTRLPNCWERAVAEGTHGVRELMDRIDKLIVEASGMYGDIKNGDKNNLRKLWQWFLTDPPRLMAKLKEVQCTSYY